MKLAILGSGLMAKGIAIEAAKSGISTFLLLPKSNIDIEQFRVSMSKFLELKYLKEKDFIESKLSIYHFDDFDYEIDIFIECIIEDLKIKRELLNKIESKLTKCDLVASNTSSLLVSDIFSDYKRKDNLIGLHFFNPVKHMKLLEVGVTTDFDNSKLKIVNKLADLMGKTIVVVNESKGYIVNRLLIPMINEAAKIHDEGVASIQDIDLAMKLGAGHPIGPLSLSDLIGNDVTLKIVQELRNIEPAKSLRQLTKEEKLGRKTKEGFYRY